MYELRSGERVFSVEGLLHLLSGIRKKIAYNYPEVALKGSCIHHNVFATIGTIHITYTITRHGIESLGMV